LKKSVKSEKSFVSVLQVNPEELYVVDVFKEGLEERSRYYCNFNLMLLCECSNHRDCHGYIAHGRKPYDKDMLHLLELQFTVAVCSCSLQLLNCRLQPLAVSYFLYNTGFSSSSLYIFICLYTFMNLFPCSTSDSNSSIAVARSFFCSKSTFNFS